MSAVIIVLHPEAGYVLGDAAIYHGDGRVARFEHKVLTAALIPAAFTTRGMFNAWTSFNLRMIAARATSPDDLLERLQALAAREGDKEIAGVIWRDGGPVGFRFDPEKFGHCEPARLGAIYGAPDPSDITALGKPLGTPEDVLGLSMPADGAALMQLQRLALHDTWEGKGHIVGGWCDCATVTATGATMETVRRWDDEIGKRITP